MAGTLANDINAVLDGYILNYQNYESYFLSSLHMGLGALLEREGYNILFIYYMAQVAKGWRDIVEAFEGSDLAFRQYGLALIEEHKQGWKGDSVKSYRHFAMESIYKDSEFGLYARLKMILENAQ